MQIQRSRSFYHNFLGNKSERKKNISEKKSENLGFSPIFIVSPFESRSHTNTTFHSLFLRFSQKIFCFSDPHFLFLPKQTSHGKGSWSLHWHRQESQGYSRSFSRFPFLSLDFFSWWWCWILKLQFGAFSMWNLWSCDGTWIFFVFVFVWCRSAVQGLPQWPEVHHHYLLTHWSC